MTINTVSHFLFNVFVTAGLVASLTACGGGGGGNGKDQNAVSSSRTSFLMGGAIQEHPLNIATVVSTFAGGAPGADGIGAAARFNTPNAIVRDGDNLYVADSVNYTIRKIVIATGAVTTLAGTRGISGSIDGTGAAARFSYPDGITTDGTNLYVTDSGIIRKIVIATGVVTTLAGSGNDGITTDGTNLYVSYNYTISKIVIATGAVSTLAGMAGVKGSADGTGAAARFSHLEGITTDGTNLYVADSDNYTIRKIVIATGAVTTFAGTAEARGSADGTGAAARFGSPYDITIDGANLYVADGDTIRKIVISTGTVTTLAGTAGAGGSADGIGGAARFSQSHGITSDGTSLFVTDAHNYTIRKIVISTGTVTTLAGMTRISSEGSADGTGTAASFDRPIGITTDGTNLYVTDGRNRTIRKIVIATGAVTTLAVTAGIPGGSDGTTGFSEPTAITTDGTNLYVADGDNYTIRKIVIATGAVTTLAGTAGVWGTADGTGAEARFSLFYGITTDGTNLYVADSNNYTIRKIVIATGAVTTLAGRAGLQASADGIGAAAFFYFPQGITTDGTNLYVADKGGIRKIVIATGTVTTLAATEGFYGGITTDGTNLYATHNNTISKIVIATGAVTTLAGTPGFSGSADGIGAAASFASPYGITTDGFELFVTDVLNNTIRKIH